MRCSFVCLCALLILGCDGNGDKSSKPKESEIAAHTDEQPEIEVRPLSDFYPLVGMSTNDPEFRTLIQKLDFSENPKRRGSWGGKFGVYLEEISNGTVFLSIRCNPFLDKKYTYQGDLPIGLIAGESKADVIQKIGEPRNSVIRSEYIEILEYGKFELDIHSGKLMQIYVFERFE